MPGIAVGLPEGGACCVVAAIAVQGKLTGEGIHIFSEKSSRQTSKGLRDAITIIKIPFRVSKYL